MSATVTPGSRLSVGFSVCFLGILAIGVGAFLGEWIAVLGVGLNDLPLGAALGAGIALVLFAEVIYLHSRTASSRIDPATYGKKVDAWIADMKGQGRPANEAFPPAFQLLAWLGFQIPPPAFLGFGMNFLWTGGLVMAIGASIFALVWLLQPETPVIVMGLVAAIVFAMLAGLGVLSAAVGRRQARNYKLPPWDQYPASPDRNGVEWGSDLPRGENVLPDPR